MALTCGLLLAAPAHADNAADRTMAKSNIGDYKSLAKRAEEAAMDDDREEKRLEKKRLRAAERRAKEAALRAERDEKDDRDDSQDGEKKDSQFDISTYQDTDFSRHSFIDLLVKSSAQPQDKPLTPDSDSSAAELFRKDGDHDGETDKIDKDKDKDSSVSLHQDLHSEKKKHFDELLEVLQPPVPPGPNNWVPDKLDPLDNGGFECSPDNGSPVPYRLNGHVDLERGRPWKDAD